MPWEKRDLIHAGGQADIHLAVETDSGAQAAMKCLRLAADPEDAADQRRRFDREVKCHLSLDHPAIMKIFGANLSGDVPHFLMPLADEGLRNLRQLIAAHEHGIDETEAVMIIRAVLDGMIHAHAEGVIHRDLKPDNIVFVAQRPVITDFGYGRRIGSSSSSTMTRGGLGTEGYAAPEQYLEGHDADERSDVYAVGCILYELFTGRKFVAGARWNEVPSAYRYVVMNATNADPERRFATMADMAAAMDVLASGGEGFEDPSERVLELAQLISTPHGGREALDELFEVLIANDTDAQLYLRVVPYLDRAIVNAMSRHSPDHFRQVVLVFDQFAEGRHPFSFTDRLAIFLCNCFDAASTDLELRQRILERVLLLGESHNRFFVGDRFVELVAGVENDPTYPPLVTAMLQQHTAAIPLVREGIMRRIRNRMILGAVR